MADKISAVVLLRDESEASAAERDFTALGFETHVIVGGSLTIMGEASLFEERFGVTLESDDTGVHAMDGDVPTRALGTGSLPTVMQPYVSAIEFEAPPDFGPSDF
jgi:hypothetical protein